MFKDMYEQKVIEFVKTKFKRIEVKPGACRWNFRCHLNAVHEAVENKEDKIVCVAYIDGTETIVHFINVNKDGVYTDNTLGHWSSQVEYYLMEEIDEGRFWKIGNVLTYYKEYLRSQVPWYINIGVKKYQN